MNASGKINMMASFGANKPSNYIIGNHPAFNKKSKGSGKRQGDIDGCDVRQTATFDHGNNKNLNSHLGHE